jgi:putative transposase
MMHHCSNGSRRSRRSNRASGAHGLLKRVERVWRRKKRRIKTGNTVPGKAKHPNHVRCYDFLEDALLSGRKVRILCVLDEFTREWLGV